MSALLKFAAKYSAISNKSLYRLRSAVLGSDAKSTESAMVKNLFPEPSSTILGYIEPSRLVLFRKYGILLLRIRTKESGEERRIESMLKESI